MFGKNRQYSIKKDKLSVEITFLIRNKIVDKIIRQKEIKLCAISVNYNFKFSRCTAVLHIALQYLYYELLRSHELLKHRMAFHAAGLFRLIISQEAPLLDGQYITVRPDLKQDTGFLVARAIRETRMRYEKCTGGKERKGSSKGRRALRVTRTKRYPERGQDRETIAVTTKSNRCHVRIQGNRKVAFEEKNDVSNGFFVPARIKN